MLDGVHPAIPDQGVILIGAMNMVFPKPPLPYPTFLPQFVTGAQRAFRKTTRKPGLDQPPPRREIGITRGQCPNRMNVVRQHDPRIDVKWPLSACLPHGRA